MNAQEMADLHDNICVYKQQAEDNYELYRQAVNERDTVAGALMRLDDALSNVEVRGEGIQRAFEVQKHARSLLRSLGFRVE